MKNKFMSWKVLLIVVGGMVMGLTGCPNDTSNTTDDKNKSLVFTNVPAGNYDVAIVPPGTTLADMNNKVVASCGNVESARLISGINLYIEVTKIWTGNGIFDVVINKKGEVNPKRKQNVTFSNDAPELSLNFNDFVAF